MEALGRNSGKQGIGRAEGNAVDGVTAGAKEFSVDMTVVRSEGFFPWYVVDRMMTISDKHGLA